MIPKLWKPNDDAPVWLRVSSLTGLFFLFVVNAVAAGQEPRTAEAKACVAPEVAQPCAATGNMWQRLRAQFRLADETHPAVLREMSRLAKSPRAFRQQLASSEPYLHYVADRVRARGLPSEVVLLPFVESGYRLRAESAKSAKGLWQLMPVTARRFGLVENWWFDPRLDLAASTGAALDYLVFLESRFSGDWLLALAAYNAGEGRVAAAMAKNRKRGRPTDFWSLELPNETKAYVPRLLALVRLIREPETHGVSLPHIADAPYLERISVAGALDLGIAAELAGTPVETILALNPALKRSMTSPKHPTDLVLPAHGGMRLRAALARVFRNEDPRYRKLVYTVQSGDSLWAIARHFGVPLRSLAGWNGIVGDEIIRPGRRLEIWT